MNNLLGIRERDEALREIAVAQYEARIEQDKAQEREQLETWLTYILGAAISSWVVYLLLMEG